MLNKQVTVINYTAPELNHLAAALAEAKVLAGYIRPYANQQRVWERILKRAPGFSKLYPRTFGRRILPPGLLPMDLHEVAPIADMAGAAVGHFLGATGKRLSERIHWHIQQRIATVGAAYSSSSTTVVASYLVAEAAFRATNGLRLLNYPIAHHRYIQRFVAEEAEREPEFSATLPSWTATPAWVEPRLDAECELADAIFVGSSFARDSFLAEGVSASKLMVMPYGADVSLFRPIQQNFLQPPRSTFRILFVGQIGQRKGISYLLKAYRALHGRGMELVLIGNFCGDGSSFIPYRDIFVHVSHLPQTALAEQYRQADVFVFPSLIEGMGLVVLEAMASGLPVITTPNGPGDIVRDGIDGFVVPIRDVEAIAERLEYLRVNPDLRLQMGRNAQQRASEYTWDAYRFGAREAVLGLIERGKLKQ